MTVRNRYRKQLHRLVAHKDTPAIIHFTREEISDDIQFQPGKHLHMGATTRAGTGDDTSHILLLTMP